MNLFEKGHQILGIISLIMSLATTVLVAISIATPRWKFSISKDIEYGLFENCTIPSYYASCMVYENVADFVNATRAFVIMGCIFVVVAIPLSALQAGGKLKHRGHVILGVDLLVAFLCLLIGCSIYTAKMRDAFAPGEEFGFSLWMAWSACALSLIAAPFGFLSKRDGYGFV